MFAIASSTPKLQMATETITSYSLRLTSSTLLEDRRAAILGLRSFAKSHPASVASDSLRGLIQTLSKDGEDIDTVKLVLETLLMLFNPDEKSPEASEEIALWLADEFTQRQENITLLLDFLETEDFYSRLYSLQLLSAILSSRPERTEECIFTAPLGISRLVATLDDKRAQIQQEGLSLLTYLTPNSTELQKLVAFENAFDRIFKIIKSEGGLTIGGKEVEDCLILLANLLRLNVSNQSLFREVSFVPNIAQLLRDGIRDQDVEGQVNLRTEIQRGRNMYAFLAVIRLFLVPGSKGTQKNQEVFCKHGVLDQVLQLAFSRSMTMRTKAAALTTCADLIRGHPQLQAEFAMHQVTSVLDEPGVDGTLTPGGRSQQSGPPNVYVIDGLLDLTLSFSVPAAFDPRLAACQCLKAYSFGHSGIRKHFVLRAKEGHTSGKDETANVLSTVLQPLDEHATGDPYRYWFASVILYHLTAEDAIAKGLAISVTEGDASNGEEEITCIQKITSNLIDGIQQKADDRVLVAYLMLLCAWLFEDPDAVNDFLGEGSNVQSLVQAVKYTAGDNAIVQGLCCILLGIVYEFSTKDSAVPRATLHHVLMNDMTKDVYIDRLTKLRSHPFLRDYEVLPQNLSSAYNGGLPEVFFDKAFVDFVKDNFSRLLRAIDRDPGYEIPVVTNGIQKGISRELVDSLRSQLEEKNKLLSDAEESKITLQRQLEQEQAVHRNADETAKLDLSRIRKEKEVMQRRYDEAQRAHDEVVQKLKAEQGRIGQDHQRQLEHVQKSSEANADRMRRRIETEHSEAQIKMQAQLSSLEQANKSQLNDHQRQLDHVQRTAEANAERARKRMEAEITDLQKELSELKAELTKTNKNHLLDLQTAHSEYTTKSTEQAARLQRAEEKAREFEARSKAADERLARAEAEIKTKEGEIKTVQEERDDLLMLNEDCEERAAKYRERLKGLGESVSDDEEEGDGDEEEEEDDVD